MRSSFFALAIALTPALAMAGQTTTPQTTAAAPSHLRPGLPPAKTPSNKVVPSLLVMSSKGFALKDGKLTLTGVSPTTIVFADRPERLAGHIRTDAVIQDWSEGPGSFAKVPPNADLSTFNPDGTSQNAVVELKNPSLQGDTLTYDVRVIKGGVPETGDESSLFIDLVAVAVGPVAPRAAVFYRY